MESVQAFLSKHSRSAWNFTALFAVTTGGITQFVDFEGFIGSYWFDMTYPVFIYIYLRKTRRAGEHKYSSPIHQNIALMLALVPPFLLETLQFFNWYKGTFDPIDFLAYLSLVVPAYLIDRRELASC